MKRIVTWIEFAYDCEEHELPISDGNTPSPDTNRILSAVDAYLEPRFGDVFTVLSHTELDIPAEQKESTP